MFDTFNFVVNKNENLTPTTAIHNTKSLFRKILSLHFFGILFVIEYKPSLSMKLY